jgi:NAD-dependent dihydropyrimidine dehydrogenase PreA subunit
MTIEYRIDAQRCKGCALCVAVCTKGVLEMSAHVNLNGYLPVARAHPEKCVYCALCCTMCPDVALTIKENAWATTGMSARGGNTPNLVKSLYLDPAILNNHNLNLKAKGIETALLRPITLFPFPEEQIATAADRSCCKAVLSVEMNMGQMVENVKRSVGRHNPVGWYGKCGGEVPTPEEVAGEGIFLNRLSPSCFGRHGIEQPLIAKAPPAGQTRSVEAFPAQQLVDLPRGRAPIRLGKDPQLVLGGQLAPGLLGRHLGIGGRNDHAGTPGQAPSSRYGGSFQGPGRGLNATSDDFHVFRFHR